MFIIKTFVSHCTNGYINIKSLKLISKYIKLVYMFKGFERCDAEHQWFDIIVSDSTLFYEYSLTVYLQIVSYYNTLYLHCYTKTVLHTRVCAIKLKKQYHVLILNSKALLFEKLHQTVMFTLCCFLTWWLKQCNMYSV